MQFRTTSPQVLWNEATRQFVMWVHVDDANYETARVGVATSPRATGPFTYHGSFRPHGQQSRDLTLFQVRLACAECQCTEMSTKLGVHPFWALPRRSASEGF